MPHTYRHGGFNFGPFPDIYCVHRHNGKIKAIKCKSMADYLGLAECLRREGIECHNVLADSGGKAVLIGAAYFKKRI